VPVGDYFTLKGEIKNVITAVAKTTHYWQEHLSPEVKQTLAWQERLKALKTQIKNWLFADKITVWLEFGRGTGR
jgi:sirohydrochlorin cobaltochelatase